MLKNVYPFGEAERIYLQEIAYLWVRSIYGNISIAAKYIFILTLCRFNNQEPDVLLFCLIKYLINRIAFSGAGTSCYKCM